MNRSADERFASSMRRRPLFPYQGPVYLLRFVRGRISSTEDRTVQQRLKALFLRPCCPRCSPAASAGDAAPSHDLQPLRNRLIACRMSAGKGMYAEISPLRNSNEPPRIKLTGYLVINSSPPEDQGEGDSSDIPALHPHIASPIKGEEPIR